MDLSDFALDLFNEKQDTIFDLQRNYPMAAKILYWMIQNVDESRAILISQSELGLVVGMTAQHIQQGLRVLRAWKLISVVNSPPHKIFVYDDINPAIVDIVKGYIQCQLYLGQEPMAQFRSINPTEAAKVTLKKGRGGTYGLYRINVMVMANANEHKNGWR